MQEWLLYDISDKKISLKNDDEYFVVSFLNLETRVKAHTYITVGYRNNQWWGQVICDELYGIYQFDQLDTSVTNSGKTLISGDSRPKLCNLATLSEVTTIVEVMCGPRSRYRTLM